MEVISKVSKNSSHQEAKPAVQVNSERKFKTLLPLFSLALAKPQYNYGNGISGTFSSSVGVNNAGGIGGGLSGIRGIAGLGGGFSSGGSDLNFQGGRNLGPIRDGSSLAGVSFGQGISGNNYQSGSTSNYNQQQTAGQFEAPLVHKQFITVAAPEDNNNLERTKHLVIGRPQKNYRVVFIKAPSSSNANVKLSAEYAPQEEKTVIYVLSKKDSSLEVGGIATPAPTLPSKPEVFFIKYKTEEEAQHAQKQIQAEYDKIEGTSEHTDAGVAPQQSVVGILDGASGNSGAILSNSANSIAAGSSITGSYTSTPNFVSSGSASTHTASKPSTYLPPAGY